MVVSAKRFLDWPLWPAAACSSPSTKGTDFEFSGPHGFIESIPEMRVSDSFSAFLRSWYTRKKKQPFIKGLYLLETGFFPFKKDACLLLLAKDSEFSSGLAKDTSPSAIDASGDGLLAHTSGTF